MANKIHSLTDVSNLFKTFYGPLQEKTYNSQNVTLAKVKKTYNFTGDVKTQPVPAFRGAGFATGSLPTATASNALKMTIEAKKVYVTVQVDRESIKASMNEEGAYVKMLKKAADDATEGFMRNMSRILFGNGDGSLGQFSGSQSGTASAPVLTVTSGSWKEANWEEGDLVNVNSDSSLFEITAVAPSTREVTLSRLSGSLDLTGIGAGTHTVYVQNSKDNDPEGLKSVLDATTGSKYNVAIQRRFQAYQDPAGAAAISEDRLNKAMLTIQQRTGKTPDLIVASFVQYRKLMDIFDDKKTIEITPRDKELVGRIALKGMEYISPAGAVPIVFERFVEDDRIYLLNSDYIEIMHRPDFGWFDDEGIVFKSNHGNGSDSYSAWYGGYLQIVIIPSFHGVITGLATT